MKRTTVGNWSEHCVASPGTVHILAPPYLFPITTKRSKKFGNERLHAMDILRCAHPCC